MEMLLSAYSVFRWLASNPEIAYANTIELFFGWGSLSDFISN